jgi:Flp pilus assembly protein TadG
MRLRSARDDRGAFAVLYAIVVVVVVMTVAVVVDLSSMREDRRAEKLATDAAATAGAIKLNGVAGSPDANAACQEAWKYLKLNLPGASGAVADCPTSSFPTSFTTCPVDVRSVSEPAGPWDVTITWPVPDSHALMTTPSISGSTAYSQPIDASTDGADACSRLGVSVGRDRDFAFATIGGFVDAATLNSSVARADLRGNINLEMPLVVLDQTGCQALYANGVGSLIEVKNNGETPGRIAMDSDGTSGGPSPGCGNAQQYVAMRNGDGARIRALNGINGALGAIFTVAVPYAKAANTVDMCPDGTDPFYTTGICPRPTTFMRITRKYWDWEYHCSQNTLPPLSAPCPNSDPDYIEQLRGQYNKTVFTRAYADANPATWRVISGAGCTVTAPVTFDESKNTFVDCPTFQVRETTVFQGGTVVFAGNLAVEGGASADGCLRFNFRPPATGESPCLTDAGPIAATTPYDEMVVYLQDGDLTRGNLDFVAPHTFLYQEASTAAPYLASTQFRQMDFGAGSSGSILITAPVAGNFKDLGIWTENFAGRRDVASTNTVNGFRAATNLVLEGIFFFPNGRVKMSGQPNYFGAARSQFVSWSLEVFGGAQLSLVPDPTRTLTIPVGGVRLIR